MKKNIIYLLLIIFSTFLNANEKVVLQLKWFHQFQFAGYYAAKEKGFYDEVGLDVEIKQRDLKYNNIDEVINGNAQYGVADSILILYRLKQQPVVIVSPIFQHSPSVFISLKKSNISSVYELNNKDILFYPNDTDGFSLIAMIKKLKENFLILLISNMLTIIMVVVAPRIHGAIANLMVTVPDSDFGFSLPMIFYYISFAIIICTFLCLRKPQAVRDIVINNTVSSSEPSISDVEKAEEMRERYRNRQYSLESSKYDAVKDYTYSILSPYMTDEYLEILCQNIKLYDIPESCIVPVKTNGTLNTLDIRHYSWNIGERLGWSGQKRATFIKLCFPTELQNVEVESMRRTLRQKGKCVIEIDVPDYNDYQFHHQK